MRLKVDRDTLGGHERALVDGFFFDGRTETSTSDVRQHYKSRGFKPASLIQPTLEAQVTELVGPSARTQVAAALAADARRVRLGRVPVLDGRAGDGQGRVPRFLGIGLPLLVLCGIASALAAAWRSRIDRGLWGVLRFLIPGGLLLLFAGAVITGFRDVPILSRVFSSGFSYEVRLGAILLALALFNNVINQARSRERAQGIALRKRLASVRRYFQQQLDRPQPALRDAVVPLRARVRPRQGRTGLVQGLRRTVGRRLVDVDLVELALDVVILVRQWLVEHSTERLERRRRLVRRSRRHCDVGGGGQRPRGRRGRSFVVRGLGRRGRWGRRRQQQRRWRRRRLVAAAASAVVER